MNATPIERRSLRAPLLLPTLLLPTLCIALAPGCSSSTFRAEDESVVMPTLRVALEAVPGRRRGAEGDPGLGREVIAGFLQTFEADLTTASG